LLTLPDGYEAASHFDWVRPSTDTVTVDGNSIKDTALIINIPDRDEYRGKGYGFVIAVEILEQEISARVYYKLLLKTQPKPGTEVPEHREEK